MNKNLYRLIWNDFTNTWNVAPETAKSRGKRSSNNVLSKLATVAKFFFGTIALSFGPLGMGHASPAINELPLGGQVAGGNAAISQTSNVMTINQSTDRASVNWSTFNVGSQATVNINQPTSTSVLLNSVNSANPSQIFGQINANGQVFLTNPSGIHFAPGSSINVGGLVATTHSMSDADFMAGSNIFNRNGATGSVINEGDLTASLNGYIALLAPEVRNHGVIIAQLGTVALAAGETFELQFDSNNTLANIRVEPATIDALVENGNAIHAPSGLIILSAQAINSLQGGVVNNTGSLEATGLTSNGGVIRLEASDSITHTGSINVDAAAHSTGNGGTAIVIASLDNSSSQAFINGSLSAKAGDLGGDGGFIETSASKLNIGDNTRVTTQALNGVSGTWLLDPTNFTITAGTAAQTTSSIGADTLQTALGSGNVSIATAVAANGSDLGDINVNAAVAWSANTLTLTAHNDININAVVDITGTGGITLTYTGDLTTLKDSATDTFTGKVNLNTTGIVTINANTYTVINDRTALNGIASGLTGNYVVGSDFDLTTTTWSILDGTEFSGNFNGFGHVIDNLTIPDTGRSHIGLFGVIKNGASITNIGLTNVNLDTASGSGAIAGYSTGTMTTVHNVFALGSVDVSANAYVGGLIGWSGGPITIKNSYFKGNINKNVAPNSGSTNIGGLIGWASNNSIIENSFSTGEVHGYTFVGGLVGNLADSTVTTSYSTSAVSAKQSQYNTNGGGSAGGLVGFISGVSNVSKSFATGNVFGLTAGGLVGQINSGTTSIIDTYASGDISSLGSGSASSGLIGFLGTGVTIGNSYSNSSSVVSDNNVRGFIRHGGGVTPTVSFSYFDNALAGMTAMSDDATYGQATTFLKTEANLISNWDFTTPIWYIDPNINNGYASLSGVTYGNAYVRVSDGASTSVYGDAPAITYALYSTASAGSVVSGGTGTASWTIPTPTSTSNAGTYRLSYSSGVTISGNYLLSAGDAVDWTITQAPLTVTANNASAVHDGLAYAGGNGVTYSAFVNSETAAVLGGTLAYIGTSQGAINAGNYIITPTGLTSGNYSLSFVDGSLTISPVTQTTVLSVNTTIPPPPELINFLATTNTTLLKPADPVLGFGTGGVSVSLETMPVLDQSGIIVVTLPKGTATSGQGFTFLLPKQLRESVQKNNASVQLTLASGKALPRWLEFDPDTLIVKSSSVPDGGFPLELAGTIADETFVVFISEREES